jgi:hypothetical protein
MHMHCAVCSALPSQVAAPAEHRPCEACTVIQRSLCDEGQLYECCPFQEIENIDVTSDGTESDVSHIMFDYMTDTAHLLESWRSGMICGRTVCDEGQMVLWQVFGKLRCPHRVHVRTQPVSTHRGSGRRNLPPSPALKRNPAAAFDIS